jgi:hypothetical protein
VADSLVHPPGREVGCARTHEDQPRPDVILPAAGLLDGARHQWQTHIAAQSPQAKGRIERLWGTLQDRLVSELRLRALHTLEQANAFLPEFLSAFIQRFARAPAEPTPVWRPAPRDLDRLLSCRYVRVVARDNTVHAAESTGVAARERGASMQVNCPKCSRPILVTDVIESSGGRLSIPRPDPEDRSLLFVYCFDHVVAQCVSCNRASAWPNWAPTRSEGAERICVLGAVATVRAAHTVGAALGNEHAKRRISGCDRVARASGAHGLVLSGGGAVGDLSRTAMARAQRGHAPPPSATRTPTVSRTCAPRRRA